MSKTIEEFISTLPELNDLDEARKIFSDATDIDVFPRLELYGNHEISRVGVQMVYAIGRGKTNWKDSEYGLFCSSCKIISDFFGGAKEDTKRRVYSIPISKIHRIIELKVSAKSFYPS